MEIFEDQIEMRYLGWKEPYASLMLPPFNKIETRTWNTNYRGLVLITASKGFYSESKIMDISGEVQTQRIFVEMLERGIKEKRGFAIAVGRLIDCRLMTIADERDCFVKYKAPWYEVKENKRTGEKRTVLKKLYCHVYADVKPIEPIEFKGAQGWRKLDNKFIETIKYL